MPTKEDCLISFTEPNVTASALKPVIIMCVRAIHVRLVLLEY